MKDPQLHGYEGPMDDDPEAEDVEQVKAQYPGDHPQYLGDHP